MVLCLICGSGATCQRPWLNNPFVAPGPSAPQVLQVGASRDQVIAAVNQNSSRVRSLSVTNAAITIPDTMALPILNGNIAAERPNRFRLTAGTIAGQELDLGSNDQLFWLWLRRNQPPAVYFCRHEQFANSNIRQMLPIEPSWLLAALGMIDIDPATVIDGPTVRGPGLVEIRTSLPSAGGNLQRVLLIEATRGYVVEQHVYDQGGKVLLASAVSEATRYYTVEQVSLPERLMIRLPTANMTLRINLGIMQINPALGQQLWTLPTYDGSPQYDLGGAVPGTPLPGQSPAPPPISSSVIPSAYAGYPTTQYPVTPAGGNSPAPITANSPGFGPLPRYGERSRTMR